MGTNNNGMFRYADGKDKVLMTLGTLGSMGDGLQIPLMMFVLSDAINSYANPNAKLSMDVVNKFSLRLLYVAIGVGLSAFVEGLCWARTAERQTSRMRLEYLRSVLRQDVGFFDTQGADSSTTFQVVSTISADSNAIQTTIGEKIPDCLAYTSSFLFCVIFSFMLSWKITLAALPLTLTFIVPGLGFGTHMMNIAMKVIESYGVAGGIAEQAISSIRTVYSYVAENQTVEKFSQALDSTMQLGIKQGLARGLMLGSMGGIYISWAFQTWLGSILVSKKNEKGGDIFVAGFNILMGGLNILTALPNLTAITEAKAAAIRITEMIDREPTIDTEDRKGKALSHVRGEIEFRGVYFSYPSRPDTPILQGIDLRFPPGKTVGLVGGSGSGKSTVVSLLQRFYDPIEGDILLDGYKIKKLHLKWLRSQMGLVNQEPVLFATSIKENILFGKEGASLEDVQNAAKAANAHDFIIKLPEAYDSQVGQFGVQLSGGQKQRIAIARALLRDPKILLMDEATSALDTQSESIVQKAIDNASQGRTAIVIAHRLSTIRMADRIVVMRSGTVAETGTHAELMQMSGEYFGMVQLQKQAQTQTQPQTPENDSDISYDYFNDRSLNRKSVNRSPYQRSINQSPYSRRIPPSPFSVSASPAQYGLSPGFSRSAPFSTTPYSVQFEDYDSEDERFEHTDSPAPSQWRLLKMNAPESGRAFLGCIGAIGSGMVQPINAYCIGGVISNYFRADKSAIQSHARTYTFIFIGLGIFNFGVNVLQHYSFAIMGERLTKRVREKLLEKLMTFEIGWFDQDDNTSAAICARLSTEASMVRSLVGDRMSLLAQAFFGATFAYAMGLVLAPKLALVMMAAQPLLIGSFYARTVLMKSMSAKAQIAQKEGSQLASEAVINHRTITAFSSQKRIVGLFKQTLEGPRRESARQSWFAGIGLFSSQFLAAASTSLAFWYGGMLLTDGKITAERLFQSFLALLFTAYIIAEAGSMTKDISRGSNAVRSVLSILDRESEIDPDPSRSGHDASKTSIKGHVELRHVHFSYPSRPELTVLKGLSLKIAAGSTVALVGQSGCGKSTIIGLIERFYDPIKGSVNVDQRDVRDYNLRTLRKHIALVSQEPTLFGGTIYENIAYGKSNAKQAEIMKAAQMANAHEFISGMQDGYQTFCGERGVQLSGGQKQRIALARAILKNPRILLLDEATSALDSVSENLVQEALEKLMAKRTCIVVAHRLSTIQKADTIAVIKEGQVVEEGSHKDLLSLGRSGEYHSLVKAQGGNSPFR